MNDVDRTSRSPQMMASDSATARHTLSSLDDIASAFPDYSRRVLMSPTYAGLDAGDPPSWERDEYVFEAREIVGRLLTSIEDCLLLVPKEDAGEDVLAPLNPGSFGGVVLGQEVQGESNGRDTVTVANAQYLVVLYGAALLTIQYETELSTRVLSDASESSVRTVKRKYTKGKRDLRKRVSNRGHTGPLTVSTSDVTVYSVDLPDSVSLLFDL